MSRLAGESGRGLEVSPTRSSAAALVGVHSHLMLFPDQAAVAFAVKDLTDFFFFKFLFFTVFHFAFYFVESYGLRSRNVADIFRCP